ncbi:LysR family transcriptional regulator [Rhodoferax koreense]|uniref:LysR family transcriptional regulator n=1 Tax=Rhodoferax koreensis TaxID=1842727 RepID=A0A1P8JYW7_9BURK|nr:LysR substrate-binding domain-containing protein [Rhodoferax koreense]APW38891.1 LysR family transcriptional regulator [Rhodoferax koreense]
MKDHQLRALIHVAERGSIRAAAKAAHLSQSALTKALRELEEDVGAELLVRSYQGVEFTPAGQALLSRARLAAATLERAREEIRQIQGGAGSRIAVAATPMVAVTALPAIWQEFRRSQPKAELTLSDGLLTSVIPGLVEGLLDFAVAVADPGALPDEVLFEPLALVEGWVAARTDHPLAQARNWAELADAQWVLNLSAGSQGMRLLGWMRETGCEPSGPIVRCTSPTLMSEMMRRTDLIGFCPKPLMEDALYGAGLLRLQVAPLPPPMPLGLLRLRNVPLSPAARPLAELFAHRLGAGRRAHRG